jgi:hypothetical protein
MHALLVAGLVLLAAGAIVLAWRPAIITPPADRSCPSFDLPPWPAGMADAPLEPEMLLRTLSDHYARFEPASSFMAVDDARAAYYVCRSEEIDDFALFLLLDYVHVPPDVRCDRAGTTPLMIALQRQRFEPIWALLCVGADPWQHIVRGGRNITLDMIDANCRPANDDYRLAKELLRRARHGQEMMCPRQQCPWPLDERG